MKKTLVALAVAAVAATSANAAVVYDNAGSKVEVNGSVRVLLAREGEQRTDLQNDGSRIEVKAQQDLNNGLKAFAAWQLRFDDGKSFGNPTTKRLFGGLTQDGVGSLSFGNQTTSMDDVQLGDYVTIWGGNSNLTGSGNKTIKFLSDDFNGFSFGLDYIFGDSSKSPAEASLTPDQEKAVAFARNKMSLSDTEVQDIKDTLMEVNQGVLDAEYAKSLKHGYGASLFYSAELGSDVNLNLTAGYGQDKKNNGTTKVNWRTAAELEFGPAAIAVNYGESKHKGKNDKTKSYLVGAKYAVTDMSTVAVEYLRDKAKAESAVNQYFVSADYKLHKNVVTFVEFGRNTTAHENKYGAGLRVFF